MSLVLRLDDDVSGPGGEPAEAVVGIHCRGVGGGLRNEALLGRLLGDAHAPADLGP